MTTTFNPSKVRLERSSRRRSNRHNQEKTANDNTNRHDQASTSDEEESLQVVNSDEEETNVGKSTSTTKATIVEDSNTLIDWSDEQSLWDLTVAKLRDELRRRDEYVAGSKRQLINRIMGKDPLCKKFRMHPESVLVEDEEEKLRKKYASSGDTVSEDENEPLEGPKGDASLWSNKQLKYKLKTLGYSTSGKRTTLLKRFRSVMHIQRQKELAGDIIADPVNQEVVYTEKRLTQEPITTPTRSKRKRELISIPDEEEKGKDGNREEEQVKPQPKRRKVVRDANRIRTKNTPVIHIEESPVKIEEIQEEQQIIEKRPRISKYSFSELDLCVSSSFIHTYNPELAFRELMSNEDVDILQQRVQDLEESSSNALIKDKNLLLAVETTNPDELFTIEVYYSDNHHSQGKVGSSASVQTKKTGTRRQRAVILQDHQTDPSLVVSLSGIQSYPMLTRLVCSGQLLTDISPLSGCHNLEQVFLSHNLIRTIPNLSKLTKLSSLSLSFNQIKDLTPLEGCHSLKYLNLSYNDQITNLAPISRLSKMEELDLSGNELTNEQAKQFYLFKMDNLVVLRLSNNYISSLRALGTIFLQLQCLFLSNNDIYDISPLIYMRKLNELDLQANERLYHSLQVYNESKRRAEMLRMQKQRELTKRSRSRKNHTSVTEAEEDELSLLTEAIYDVVGSTQENLGAQEMELKTWITYGRTNMEVLDCLVQWGTSVIVGEGREDE